MNDELSVLTANICIAYNYFPCHFERSFIH